ncbi:hypothetical protein [Pseudoxanthomonas sp. CF125]|uniref:hypothetical protein n=1 Tax=Pseudoxanthomonas sp. CF125 TaxID=1855303 RepID=UPI00089269E8|nr:hypothetical protein [Pseudoxanthomonas sp. CF125]SDQ59166.1 hypothetical protein SAMN05216569_1720 [Pseudoxanthomonas sp. CF125]
MHKTKVIFALTIVAAIAIIYTFATDIRGVRTTLFGAQTDSPLNTESSVSAGEDRQSGSTDNGLSSSAAKTKASENVAPATSSAHSTPTERPRPVESLLVSPGGLKTGYINAIIGVDEFDRVLDRLRTESYTDPDATQISKLYEEILRSSLKSSDTGVSLNKLACGLTVCAASFNGSPMDEGRFTTMLLGAGSERGVGIYSAIVRAFPPPTPNDPATYRVFFSTDRNNNTITVD